MLKKNLLNSKERINWLRLGRSQNVGPKTFINLLKIYGTATKALENLEDLAKRGGANKKIKIALEEEVCSELEKVNAYGARIFLSCDDEYPKLLRQTNDHPCAITVKGDVELLHKRTIAIVGARNASLNGRNFAKNLAADLSKAGFIVASGLARGIDTSAHLGCEDLKTIAVIAGGIDHIYPIENKTLYEKISSNGLIVAELPIGSSPVASHFPQRNRIISGVSIATAVIEAAMKSGSLITAKYAKAHKREVFAVPGSPLDSRCGGTNALIKDGAHLLESAKDIINIVNRPERSIDLFSDINNNFLSPTPQTPSEREVDRYRPKVWEMISFNDCSEEQLIDALNIPTPIFNLIILELELAGKIERLYGNKIVRIG